jgi:hypothetical protein
MGQQSSSIQAMIDDDTKLMELVSTSFSLKELRSICYALFQTQCTQHNKKALIHKLLSGQEHRSVFTDFLVSLVEHYARESICATPEGSTSDVVIDSVRVLRNTLKCGYRVWYTRHEKDLTASCHRKGKHGLNSGTLVPPSADYDTFNQCPLFYKRSKHGCCVKKQSAKFKAAVRTVAAAQHLQMLHAHTIRKSEYATLLTEASAQDVPGLGLEDYERAQIKFDTYMAVLPLSTITWVSSMYGVIIRKLELWVFQNLVSTHLQRRSTGTATWGAWSMEWAVWAARRTKDRFLQLVFILLKSPILLWIITKSLIFWKSKKCKELAVQRKMFVFQTGEQYHDDAAVRDKEYIKASGSAMLVILKESGRTTKLVEASMAWLTWLPILGPAFKSFESIAGFLIEESLDAFVLWLELTQSFTQLFAFFTDQCPPIPILDAVRTMRVGQENVAPVTQEDRDQQTWQHWFSTTLQPAAGTPAHTQTVDAYNTGSTSTYAELARQYTTPPPQISENSTTSAAFALARTHHLHRLQVLGKTDKAVPFWNAPTTQAL